jgi:hypothetical protein
LSENWDDHRVVRLPSTALDAGKALDWTLDATAVAAMRAAVSSTVSARSTPSGPGATQLAHASVEQATERRVSRAREGLRNETGDVMSASRWSRVGSRCETPERRFLATSIIAGELAPYLEVAMAASKAELVFPNREGRREYGRFGRLLS